MNIFKVRVIILGGALVEKVNRTAQCKKCGEVLFKIKSGIGEVVYCCVQCNNEVEIVKCEKYATLLPLCQECGGDTFKARIKVDKEHSLQQHWDPECIECKGTPKSVYLDGEGNLIDESTRIVLIVKDLEEEVNMKDEFIKVLEGDLEKLNTQIEEKNSVIDNLNSEIEEKYNCIYNLEYKLEDSKRQMSNLEYELEVAKKNISILEERISYLQWDINRLA